MRKERYLTCNPYATDTDLFFIGLAIDRPGMSLMLSVQESFEMNGTINAIAVRIRY